MSFFKLQTHPIIIIYTSPAGSSLIFKLMIIHPCIYIFFCHNSIGILQESEQLEPLASSKRRGLKNWANEEAVTSYTHAFACTYAVLRATWIKWYNTLYALYRIRAIHNIFQIHLILKCISIYVYCILYCTVYSMCVWGWVWVCVCSRFFKHTSDMCISICIYK